MAKYVPTVVNGKKAWQITLPLCIQSILRGKQNKNPLNDSSYA